jgi:hypothetical protein
MLVRAVTKAWQESLDGPPSIGRVYRPKVNKRTLSSATLGWCRPGSVDLADHAANDDVGPEPRGQSLDRWGREDSAHVDPKIFPKRPGVATQPSSADSLWTSYEFWMGIVAGASIVLVIKTVLAVQAPFGVYWY